MNATPITVLLPVLTTVAAVGQIVVTFVLYNGQGHELFRNLGWAVLWISAVFGWLPIFTLRRKGGVPKRKAYVHTTMLVDTGIYAIVRHPQFLAGILMSLALTLIAQHCVVGVLGAIAAVSYYLSAIYEEKSSLHKFGDAYRSYMTSAPRMNAFVGAVRLIRRSRTSTA